MRDSAFIHALPSSGSIGNFNNHILVNEFEGIASLQNTEESVLGTSMEVDGDMLVEREIQLEGISNISLTDLDASRWLLNDFLTQHTAYELFPHSGKIVALDISLPIKQGFHVLYEQGISVAPLWDSKEQQFVGMLTASDFIEIVMQIQAQQEILSEDELETHTIEAWKQEKYNLASVSDSTSPLHFVGPDDTLKSVIKDLLHYRVATLPVLYIPADNWALPQLLHLASLSGVLKCLCRHFQHATGSLPLLNLPIGSLPIGTWKGEVSKSRLVVLRASDSLNTALSILMQARVSAIPIVDKDGCLEDIFARSDITALARENVYAHVQLAQLTIEEVLHLGRASTSVVPVLRCQMCFRTEALHTVLERLAITGDRRIVCVEATSHHVEGIITLTDIFSFLISEC